MRIRRALYRIEIRPRQKPHKSDRCGSGTTGDANDDDHNII